jgi:hypothetical protein
MTFCLYDMHDIFATLAQENDATLQMLDDIDANGMRFDPSFDNVERALLLHAQWITSELFREIAKHAGADVEAAIQLARTSYRMMVERLLPRARHSNPDLGDRTDAMQSLRTVFARHIAMEQSIFDDACGAMTAEQREDLDQRYADWRRSSSAGLLVAKSIMKVPTGNAG